MSISTAAFGSWDLILVGKSLYPCDMTEQGRGLNPGCPMLALATGPKTSQVGFMFLVQLHQWGWGGKKGQLNMNLWKMQVAVLAVGREYWLSSFYQALVLASCDLCSDVWFFCARDIIHPECSQCMRWDARHSSSAPHRISLLLVNTTPFLHWVEKYRAPARPRRLCGGFEVVCLQLFIEKHGRLADVWNRVVLIKVCVTHFCFVLLSFVWENVAIRFLMWRSRRTLSGTCHTYHRRTQAH